MPPFGDEIEEPLKKPLPFWSLSHAQSARPSKPKPVKAFGAEPDEPVSCPVPAVESRRGSGQRGCMPSSASTVFGSEPEESVGHRAPKVRRKDSAKSIFGEEQEEDDSSSRGVGFPFAPRESDSDEQLSDHDFLPKSQSVFSLGWHCVTNFKYATFWKDNIDDPKSKPTARKYDNTKRSSKAAYHRKNNGGSQKKNGTDPARLETLFKANTCQCAMSMCFVFLFRSFLCFQIVGMCKKNETSHLQNHHHPTTGALKICFKQFRDSKDLVAFLERFWGMSKQDQDALVPIQKYDIFSTPIQQILVGYPYTQNILVLFLLKWPLPRWRWNFPNVKSFLHATCSTVPWAENASPSS